MSRFIFKNETWLKLSGAAIRNEPFPFLLLPLYKLIEVWLFVSDITSQNLFSRIFAPNITINVVGNIVERILKNTINIIFEIFDRNNQKFLTTYSGRNFSVKNLPFFSSEISRKNFHLVYIVIWLKLESWQNKIIKILS